GAYAVQRQSRSARVTARRRAHVWRIARRASGGAAAVGGAVAVAIVAAGGTFALWNDTGSINAGVISTGSGETSIRFAVGDPASATAAFANMLPGESMTIPVQLQNDGDLDLSVAATLTQTTG